MLHRTSDYANSHLVLLLIWLILSNALLSFLDDSLNSPVSSIVIVRGGLRQQQLNDVPVLLGCSGMDGLLPSCILCIGISTPLCNARLGVSAIQDLVSVQTKCSSNHSAGCGLSILCIGISTPLCNGKEKSLRVSAIIMGASSGGSPELPVRCKTWCQRRPSVEAGMQLAVV